MLNETIMYYGRSFEIPHIKKDSCVPVGGSIFTDNPEITMFVDWNGLESLISEMKEIAPTYYLPELKSWLKSARIEVDEQLFAPLFAFTSAYDKRIGFDSDPSKRFSLYRDNSPNLSDIVKGNAAACSEIAALAQLYLQEQGIVSSYFAGEVLWNKEQEFGEPHAFILVNYEGKEFIFDPSNPHSARTSDGQLKIPRIHKVDSFKEKIRKGKKTYVETINVLTKLPSWYGVGDGTSVTERDLA
jgi:hypothetical protein